MGIGSPIQPAVRRRRPANGRRTTPSTPARPRGASPRVPAELRGAVEGRQLTAEGEPRLLPEPFFVIATQNPSHQIGTFPLPESQIDRFLMRISLGYPSKEAKGARLMDRGRRDPRGA